MTRRQLSPRGLTEQDDVSGFTPPPHHTLITNSNISLLPKKKTTRKNLIDFFSGHVRVYPNYFSCRIRWLKSDNIAIDTTCHNSPINYSLRISSRSVSKNKFEIFYFLIYFPFRHLIPIRSFPFFSSCLSAAN